MATETTKAIDKKDCLTMGVQRNFSDIEDNIAQLSTALKEWSKVKLLEIDKKPLKVEMKINLVF